MRSQYRKNDSLWWWTFERARHNLFVSDMVVAELSDARYPHRDTALAFIEDIPVLAITEPMVALAKVFADRKVMPKPISGDALHVAVATVENCKYVLHGM
ncbi:MAG: hypothetical protein BWX88_00282 [Planctomycetes bacterium ADurb.Bin126]|nr:MAG: hypothetical protein BWX88_00282 [Planctomycetes bacterium ADurb.Bin126]